MGKGWKTAGKVAEAQKKGKVFMKFAREITVATKMGGADLSGNARLKLAIQQARAASCPKDTIDRAIKRGSGEGSEDVQYHHLTYEGHAPHRVGIIVECQTDNKNRTISEVRNIFNKNGGQIGESGSVMWMFDKVSLVSGVKSGNFDNEEEAIEVGAEYVEAGDTETDKEVLFYGRPEDLESICTELTKRNWEIRVSEISYRPKELKILNEEQKKSVFTLLEALENCEDSYRIHATCS